MEIIVRARGMGHIIAEVGWHIDETSFEYHQHIAAVAFRVKGGAEVRCHAWLQVPIVFVDRIYDAATAQQHLDLYSTLVLVLLEDNMSIIENVSEIDKNSGLKAWIALVDHYEDDGIYRLAEPLQDMEKAHADDDTCLQYLNRLVRFQRQLARGGEDVDDRRVIIYLVTGLRKECHSMTYTWDVHNLGMDADKRDLRQKGMHIESHGRTHTEAPPPAPFPAFSGDTSTNSLKREVHDLQKQLTSMHGYGNSRGVVVRVSGARSLRGICFSCG
jgi:hypothetical protein